MIKTFISYGEIPILIIITGIGFLLFAIALMFEIGISRFYFGLGFLILIIGIFLGRRESKRHRSE